MFQRVMCSLGLALFACSGPSKIDLIDKVPPTLKSSDPSDGQIGVLPTALIFIEFSEKMDTDSITISSTPTVLLGPPSWDLGDQVATFPTASMLQPSTQYFFTINGTDLAGNAMVAKTISFTTASSAEACQNVVCDPLKGSQCVNGECRCGDLSACTGNQTCVFENNVYSCEAPAAICSPQCQGNTCCDQGNRCVSSPEEAFHKCGTACQDCSAYGNRADSCGQGVCGCGTGAACAVGQRCNAGQCVCDSSSCPAGCCSNYESGTCVAYVDQTISNCGTNGFRCSDYTGRAATCTNGVAKCGSFNACGVNQACTGGQCTVPTCNAQNCANGCCNGPNPTLDDCLTVKTFDKCGPNGGACEDLTNKIDACGPSGGTCGGNAACEGEEKCLSGACKCEFTYCQSTLSSGSTVKACCLSNADQFCKLQGSGGLSFFTCAQPIDCTGAPSCLSSNNAPGCCEFALTD